MIAPASGLHPIRSALTNAEIQFSLQDAAAAGSSVLVELTYRPRREWDVRKERHLHLFDSPWRAGSRDLIKVIRDEAHQVRMEVRAEGDAIRFSVPLRDADPPHSAYQLATVRVGDLTFQRWFTDAPQLDRGFGLECTAENLRGAVRLGGIDAAPLDGALPLWPTLRTVELSVERVTAPVIRLWEPDGKYWHGWRQASPQDWPGGRTSVARHVSAATVWRAHGYYAIPSADAPSIPRAVPPANVLPGVALEVYWPDGPTLEFPDTRFDEVTMIRAPLSRVTTRDRELLALSVAFRPGVEMHSISAAEWAELEAPSDVANEVTAVDFAVQRNSEGKELLVAQRRDFREPWLFIFGTKYDSGRRVVIHPTVLYPTAWTGDLPE